MICHMCKLSAPKKQQKTSYLEDPGFKVANTCSMEQPDGKFNSFDKHSQKWKCSIWLHLFNEWRCQKNTCNFRYQTKTHRTPKTPKTMYKCVRTGSVPTWYLRVSLIPHYFSMAFLGSGPRIPRRSCGVPQIAVE